MGGRSRLLRQPAYSSCPCKRQISGGFCRCAMGSITSPSPRPLQLQHRFTISKQHISVVCRAEPPAQKDKQEEPVYLSDFMKFEVPDSKHDA